MTVEGVLTAAKAALIEQVEAANLTAQIEVLAACGALPESRCIRFGTATAGVTHERFGRKLNHVLGLGMGEIVSDRQLFSIEDAYARINCAVEIDLCPFADPSSLDVLARRGYVVNAFIGTYVRDGLTQYRQSFETNPISVRLLGPEASEHFVELSIAGFAAQAAPRSSELLQLLALSALRRQDSTLFAAEIDGQIAGTAAVSIFDLGSVRAAHLHLASTLREFRGRGVQVALLRARLRQAAEAGASFATITARPANGSARNATRAGFRLAYVKPTFFRPSNHC